MEIDSKNSTNEKLKNRVHIHRNFLSSFHGLQHFYVLLCCYLLWRILKVKVMKSKKNCSMKILFDVFKSFKLFESCRLKKCYFYRSSKWPQNIYGNFSGKPPPLNHISLPVILCFTKKIYWTQFLSTIITYRLKNW